MLINNSLYTYDINIEFDYIGDFLLGNSIVNISILYVCSFTFGFCNWYRHIITTNLINIIIATIDKVFHTKGEAVARCDNELPLSSF